MLGHLNVALLLRAQRSSRHKNCRIVWLMFNSIFNSKRSSTWDYQKKYYICSSTYPRKRVLLAEKSDNHVLYHIASQIWQLLQHGMGSY